MEELKNIKSAFVDAVSFTEVISISNEDLMKINMTSGLSTGIKMTALWKASKAIKNDVEKLHNLTESDIDEIADYIAEKKEISKEKATAITLKFITIFKELLYISNLLKN